MGPTLHHQQTKRQQRAADQAYDQVEAERSDVLVISEQKLRKGEDSHPFEARPDGAPRTDGLSHCRCRRERRSVRRPVVPLNEAVRTTPESPACSPAGLETPLCWAARFPA